VTKQSPEIASLPAYRRQALAMTARGMSTYLKRLLKYPTFAQNRFQKDDFVIPDLIRDLTKPETSVNKSGKAEKVLEMPYR